MTLKTPTQVLNSRASQPRTTNPAGPASRESLLSSSVFNPSVHKVHCENYSLRAATPIHSACPSFQFHYSLLSLLLLLNSIVFPPCPVRFTPTLTKH